MTGKAKMGWGLGILGGLLLIGGSKKASAKQLVIVDTPKTQDVVIDESPAAQKEPTPAPPAKPKKLAKRAAPKAAEAEAPASEVSAEAAQAALAQVWPLIESGRASEDQLLDALVWARKVNDTDKIGVIDAKLRR